MNGMEKSGWSVSAVDTSNMILGLCSSTSAGIPVCLHMISRIDAEHAWIMRCIEMEVIECHIE